jgi:type I restriction enzyme S subunit
MKNVLQQRTYWPDECVVFRKTKEEYGGLSNMAAGFPLFVNGRVIWSSEALYQACRFPLRPEVQEVILAERSPMTAKMKSKHFREFTRSDWEIIKIKVMRWCLRVKLAQNWDEFGRLLLSTGQRPIVEESHRDTFWGAERLKNGTLVGTNVLGRFLMELRRELIAPTSQQLRSVPVPDIPNFLLLGRTIKFLSGSSSHAEGDSASLQGKGLAFDRQASARGRG